MQYHRLMVSAHKHPHAPCRELLSRSQPLLAQQLLHPRDASETHITVCGMFRSLLDEIIAWIHTVSYYYTTVSEVEKGDAGRTTTAAAGGERV